MYYGNKHLLNLKFEYRAHIEPLFYANRMLTVFDINAYMSGVFMHKCLQEPTTDIFRCYYQTNRDVHGRDTRNAALNVPFARLDIRKLNMRIHGAVIWNALPPFVCNSASLILFKQRLRNYFIESKLSAWLYSETCIERPLNYVVSQYRWSFTTIKINIILLKMMPWKRHNSCLVVRIPCLIRQVPLNWYQSIILPDYVNVSTLGACAAGAGGSLVGTCNGGELGCMRLILKHQPVTAGLSAGGFRLEYFWH